MQKAKRIFVLSLCLLLLLACSACRNNDGGETPTGDAKAGGEITVGIAADLDSSLDPHKSSGAAGTREVLFNVFEGLVKPDTDGNLVPAVASEYAISDAGDQFTFTLREGVKFHNGDPVTAEDVVWSISRAAGLDSGTPIVNGLDSIASVEAADDSTVVITLVEPNIEFLAYLTVAILPAGYEQQDTAPVGTGPFKFVSRSAQENIVLERFEDYWGEPALLDKVTFKIIEDGSALVMALQSGAVDLTAHLTSSQCAELGNMEILQGTMNLVQALYLNNAEAPFDDIRVRQALSYAIDKQQIIDMTSDGAGVPLGSSMYPAFGKYFMDELTDYYPYDPDKAKELLADAGYDESNPLSFTITVPSNYTPHVDAAQIMVDQLSKVGVKAKMEQVEWATWYSDVYQGRKFQSTVCGMDASAMTARAMLERFNSASPKDFINFVNAPYDDAFNRAISARDEDSQLQAYRECMTILTEQAANVYVQDLADLVAINPQLTGYRFYPLYVMDLSGVGFRE